MSFRNTPAPGGDVDRSDSAIASLLANAGQALAAVGSPSSRSSAGSRTPQLPAGRHLLLSPTDTTSRSPTGKVGFGVGPPALHPPAHPQLDPHPQLHPHHRNPITPPATAAASTSTLTTDNFQRLPPPVSGSGTGSGSGLGSSRHHHDSNLPYNNINITPRTASATAAVPLDYPPPHQQQRQHHCYDGQRRASAQSSSSASTSPSLHARPFQASGLYRRASHASPDHSSPTRPLLHPPQSAQRLLPPSNVLVPELGPSTGTLIPIETGSERGAGTDTLSASGQSPSVKPRPMFDLPSIPTSDDDFASIPYLNADINTTAAAAPTAVPSKNAMSQPQQPPPQYSATPRRPTGYGDDQQQLQQQQQHQHHMQGGAGQYPQHGQMSPRDYSTPSTGPHIKLDQAGSNPPSYHGTPSVPSVLQPGGPLARPPTISANTAPSLPALQGSVPQQQQQHPSDYQSPAKPSLSLSHSYSRSSPAAAYDANPGFSPYTPTTPNAGGPSSSQFMSPDRAYIAPGSQRTMSHTPLGLADIRPRADSSLSDGMHSGADFAMQNTPPGTSSYLAPWATYAFDWCKWAPQGNGAGKVAIGSYLEDGHNFIQILDTQIVPTPSDVHNTHGGSKWTMDFTKIAEATHSYPVTRLLWEPPSSTKQSTDLLATSGDHLRLWSLPAETPSTPGNSITGRNREAAATKLTPLALLSNSKTPDHTAPLTSLDWNTVSPSLIITSSIDTTCTIWDIPSLTAKTQLIAHDKEVYDVRFCANSVDVFVSCGQDGSVRMFDLRSLEHSTIIYEPTGKEDRVDPNGGKISPTLAQQTMSNPPPLLRIATSPHDTQLLATFAQDSNVIRILDTRQPGQALLELRGHGGALNCVEWSPTRRGQLASGGDDCQVLLWDLMNHQQSNGTPQSESVRSPAASWQCDYEVSNLGWVPRLPNDDAAEWLGVSAGRGIWGVRM